MIPVFSSEKCPLLCFLKCNLKCVNLNFTHFFYSCLKGGKSKFPFFFVAYLPELAADPNKKKSVVLTLDIKNVLTCQISV